MHRKYILLLISVGSNFFQVIFSQDVMGPEINMEDFFIEQGYPIETHSVVTEDGYIIGVHRVPARGKPNPNLDPVILMHGMITSADSWIYAGRNSSLPCLLANMGYDVWMPNARGTHYSDKHKWLKRSDSDFWKFSWHEIGKYDIPAVIDHVLNTTNKPQVAYVGHSQGTTVFFVMGSERPEYQPKISVAVMLAPSVFLNHTRNPALTRFAPLYRTMDRIMNTLNFFEFKFGISDENVRNFFKSMCSPNGWTDFCLEILSLITGPESKNFNRDLIPRILGSVPAGQSTMQIIHYSQSMATGEFMQYDYGPKKNMKIYNSTTPPRYNLNISTPIALFYSKDDIVNDKKDVLHLAKILPNLVDKYEVPYPNWTHLDFLVANNVVTMIFDREEFFIEHGYPIETHSVVTEDGYIIGVHRVPARGKPNPNLDPVILMHGLITSADNWIYAGRNSSLPCLLADLGYDVWMPNARGTHYSDKHKWLKKSDSDFWKFSWHEIGKYDIPAVIDHVLNTTNKPQAAYVGHSQGTTVFFVMGSERPQYQAKISVAVMLAPPVFLNNTKNLALIRFAPLYRTLNILMNRMNFFEFMLSFSEEKEQNSYKSTCSLNGFKDLCLYIWETVIGVESNNFNRDLIPKILDTVPAGQSTMQLIHFLQIIDTGEFMQYDYGPKKNMKIYNSTTPPRYNLNISTPIALFYSKDESIIDKKDVLRLAKILPNLVDQYEVPYPNWSHLNFIVANNVVPMIYDRVIKLLGQYANEEFFIEYGYPIETHSVVTEDGYLIGVHRVPARGNPNPNLDPVILMHGLFTSAENWIYAGRNSSLPCLLADLGYDVWMPNARGTQYSDKHKWLKRSDSDFWKFSWHEIGKHDIPAVIDHVLNTTNKPQVAYVGHSQGTTVFFVMGSERPEYQPKISVAVMLAPSVFLNHSSNSAFIRFTHLYKTMDRLMNRLNFFEFSLGFSDENVKNSYKSVCSLNGWKDLCLEIWDDMIGVESKNFNRKLVPKMLDTVPAGQSTMQIIHYSQSISTGEFMQYDFGPKKNMKIYNSTTPPRYNLNISTPIALFYSKDEIVVDKKDVLRLAKILPNLVDQYEVPYPNWKHLNFIAAKNVEEFFIEHGYPIETHSVVTEDGYIIGVHRVPARGKPNPNLDPVILMHGLLTNAENWIYAGRNSSLPCLLADMGYDVWMPNARGTQYSDKHKWLKRSDSNFWKFSWHEIGKHDIPAVIDHVLNTTNKPQVAYVGHSQGTTVFFVMGSERPEYQPKISVAVMLAPSVFLNHTSNPALTRFAPLYRTMDRLMNMLNFFEFKLGFSDENVKNSYKSMCVLNGWRNLCLNIMSMMTGAEYKNFNQEIIPKMLGSVPAGQSTMQIIHYSQSIATGEFMQYDYGPKKNMKIYNSTTPPRYNLNISTPIALFYSKDDIVNDKKDVLRLAKILPNLVDKYEVPYPHWTHLDFIVANNVQEFVKNLGYPVETYNVETKDGYILKLFRIPHGKKNSTSGPPVILMHGLLGSSENYIILGEKSLAIMAAEAGYDVWLGNVRGNMHSRNHTTLNPDKDPLFWDFSWHEMGVYDVPAIIDFILNKTGYKTVAYVGHSQGGTIFCVMATEKPEYKKKVSVFIGLAPGVVYDHVNMPLMQSFIDTSKDLYDDMVKLNHRESFFMDYNDLRFLTYALSKHNQRLILEMSNIFMGESEVTDWKAIFNFSGTMPAGCSLKQMEHFSQLTHSKSFRQFDYGREQNLKKYNNTIPPNYDLAKMDVPTYIYIGQNDIVVTMEDMNTLVKLLPNVKELYVIPVKKFTHVDYVVAKHADKLMYNKIIKTLGHYQNKRIDN
ncbi:unnamed protein product [Brassicogethes aeneus]|uniref:Uncharacterized protein n=1 Tax=Brassicogethes aeneus TaxID=1431903 RepID=A0A9P0FCH2_BRAAE|nr:unnamed protein product [Brassicogethes aeneus]